MTFQVVELLLEGGTSPCAKWLEKLAPVAAAKIVTAIFRMEAGNPSSAGWFRGTGEYKLETGARVTGSIHPKTGCASLCFLAGAARNGKDIDLAVERWESYKRRKANEARRR